MPMRYMNLFFQSFSPVQDLFEFLDRSEYTSLACTCKHADKVRQDRSESAGFCNYFERREIGDKQTVCANHISSLLDSTREAYFGSPRNAMRASGAIFFTINRLLSRSNEWDVRLLESFITRIEACYPKNARCGSEDSFQMSQVLKTRIRAMIDDRPLTEQEQDDQDLHFDEALWNYESRVGEIRERLDLGFDRGPLVPTRDLVEAISSTCGSSKYAANLSTAMVELEKRSGRSNADISMATQVAATIGRSLESAIFYGYFDESLRVFNRSIDVVFPL